MVSKALLVIMIVALASKPFLIQAAPAPAPAPQPDPVLGYLLWHHGLTHGIASGLGMYGLIDILSDDDDKKQQPIMFVMPQGGQPVAVSLRRNGNGNLRQNPVQIVQLPSNIASTVQSLS